MKIERIILVVVALVFLITLAGCTRSRGTGVSAQAALAENLASEDVVSDEMAGGAKVSDEASAPDEAAEKESASSPTRLPDESDGSDTADAALDQPLTNGISPVLEIEETDKSGSVSVVDSLADGSPLNHTTNILLLGSDRRPDETNWRTDVLMLLALDFDKGQAAVISLPRDIYMDVIPGHQPNKINVIDYLGERDEAGTGPAFLASILEEKLGIPFHYYLRFDFEGFKDVVDGLDGLELTIECRVYEYLPEENISLYLEPGIQRLDGKMALGYVRARNQGGDLERARRQQRVVWAVRNQLFNENQLPHVPALYAALRNTVQTDIGFVDAIRFARFALNLTEDDIHGMVIGPPDQVRPDWRGGMSVWVADWPLIAQRIQTVFERPPLIETNTVGQGGDRVQCP